MRRAIGWVGTAALALTAVWLAGTVALGSDSAVQGLLRGATALAGERLSIGEVRGNLRRGLQLERVDLRLGGVRVQAAALDWVPGDSTLWRRRVTLGRITLDDLRVTLDDDGSPAAQAPGLPQLTVPAHITLQSLTVRGFTLTPAGGAPLRLEALQLAGSLQGSRLHLGQVSARAAQGSLDAALRLDFAGTGRLDGWVQGTLRQPDGPPLELTGMLGGSLVHGAQAALYARAPATARLLASWDSPLAGGPWQAHLWLDGSSLTGWRTGLPPWALAAEGRARGRGADAVVSLDYRLERTPAGMAHGRLAAQGTGALWAVAVDVNAEPARIDLSGRLDLAAESVNATLAWRALQWPLGAVPAQVQSPRGSARLTGALDDWALTLDAALSARGQAGELAARARGNAGQAWLDGFTAQLAGGRLDGYGELRWASGLNYTVTASARGLNPSLLWPQWPGRIDVDLTAAGDAGALDLQLARLCGTLRGRPIDGGGKLAWQAQALRLSDVDLQLGRASLHASGTVLGTGPPLVGTLDVPAANDLLPGAHGRLHARARISGPAWAQASVALQATDLAWSGQAVDAISAQLDLDRPRDRLSLKLDADGVRLGERRLSLRLAADGAATDHAVHVMATHNDQRLSVDGRGNLLDNGWQGRITHGRLDGLPPQTWTLAGPLALDLRQAQQSVGRHCWQAGAARVCGSGRRGDGVLDVSAQIEALPLAPLIALADADVATDGQLDGQLRLHQAGGPLLGELHLTAPAGELRMPMPDGSQRRFAHGGARVEGSLDAGGGHLAVQLVPASADEADLLDASLRLPSLPAIADAPLRGTLAAHWPDIGLFEPWLPQLAGLAGRMVARLQLDGTLGAPRLTGEADLREARAAVPALGIELREVQLRLSGDGGDTLRVTGSARSGEGELRLQGEGRRAPGGTRTRLTITGDQVQVFDTAQLQARVRPNLDILLADDRLSVSGDIAVPYARIHAQDRAAAVQTSPDVVVQGREATDAQPLAAQADLRVVLGDDVRVDAYGFRGQLGGGVRLRQRPDGTTAVTGQVNVTDGQYTFYGQRLPVTEGELRYAGGPPDNPALRITAMRNSDGVTAGVRLRGTAKAPTTQLFSSPAMPQADILSWLVLGRPLNQAKGSEGDLLMQAAASAGLRGGSTLVKRLGQTLGFEEAKLGGDGGGGANLALGRYLSPRLYVGYGLALAEQTNAVTLRYTLTEQWLLEVVSGLTQTADLLYQIER